MIVSFESTLSGTENNCQISGLQKLEGWSFKGELIKQCWNEKRFPHGLYGSGHLNRVVVKGEGLLYFTLLIYL